jgi:hypothetical protein
MSSGIFIMQHQSAQIIARPQLDAFYPDRLLIKNGGRWNLDAAAEPGNQPGAFYPTGKESLSGAAFSPAEWRPLPMQGVACGDNIALGVTYIGPHAAPFEAVLFGWDGPPPTTSEDRHDDTPRISERATSPKVAGHETVKLPLRVANPSLFADHLTIMGAQSWVVNNICVHGKSIFVQEGDIPGEMFSVGGHANIILGSLTVGDLIEVEATYLGDAPFGRLVIELSGTTRPPRQPPANTIFLPMSTGVHILPTTSAQITGRPQKRLMPPGCAFLPERVVVAKTEGWCLNDIKVGTLSQFVQSGDVPGVAFSSDGLGCHVRFQPVRSQQDFVIVITYVGDRETGESFCCGVQGRLVCLP